MRESRSFSAKKMLRISLQCVGLHRKVDLFLHTEKRYLWLAAVELHNCLSVICIFNEWERRTNIRFLLFSFWKGFMGVSVVNSVQIFKIFSYFCSWKNRNKMSYEKFFLKFPYIFSKTTLGLYFYKSYKFMKICYNCFQHLSEFHQIIKHFYNFLKRK